MKKYILPVMALILLNLSCGSKDPDPVYIPPAKGFTIQGTYTATGVAPSYDAVLALAHLSASDVVLTRSSSVWTQLATGPAARRAHAAAPSGGKMYVFGGYVAPAYVDDLWVYDTAGDTWSQFFPAPGPSARGDHTAVADVANIYVFAGQGADFKTDLSDLWKYDTVLDAWTQLASGPTARRKHAAAVDGGKMYVFGGISGKDTYLDSLWAYEFSSDTWTQLASGATGRIGHAMAASNGKIYVFGGYNGSALLNDLWEYDIAADAWTLMPSGATAVPSGRSGHTIAANVDSLYLFGGGLSTGTYFQDVWEYRTATNEWMQKTSGAIARWQHTTVIDSGTLYVFGGRSGAVDTANLADVWAYLLADRLPGPVTTVVIDLGSVPTVNGKWKFTSSDIPAGTAVAFTAEASDTGAFGGEELLIGPVADGDPITDLYQYYRVTAVISP